MSLGHFPWLMSFIFCRIAGYQRYDFGNGRRINWTKFTALALSNYAIFRLNQHDESECSFSVRIASFPLAKAPAVPAQPAKLDSCTFGIE
jgi:hypothetical protein